MKKAILLGVFLSISGLGGCKSTFERMVDVVGRDDAIVFTGEGGSKVLVSPRLQGRIMTTKVGSVESVGFVSVKTIEEGENHPNFNNFGGQDRLWLGPEAGQFGIYFEPGVELTRENWTVPADFDKGPFQVEKRNDGMALLTRDISVKNYSGTSFQVKAAREVGIILSGQMSKDLGVELPEGVSYAGSYSDNKITNTGDTKWDKEKGLVNIWILGQLEPGPKTVIIAPFKPGQGQPYRDEPYFGKIPEDRLKLLENALLLRADANKEGKVGIPQNRTTGIAGSFDFIQNLLVVVKFDVPKEAALYANSSWEKKQAEPYSGDLFQTYNSNRSGTPDQRYAFYELESVSPSVELGPGESVRQRHETHCFQGDYVSLRGLAWKILAVDLDRVKEAMGF